MYVTGPKALKKQYEIVSYVGVTVIAYDRVCLSGFGSTDIQNCKERGQRLVYGDLRISID
jgi:hypothetical protein